MLSNLLAWKAAFENGCMAFCLWTLGGLAAFALLCATGALRDTMRKWTRLGKFDRAFIVLSVAFITLTGATKSDFWRRVTEDTADTGIALVGVFTGISNDVQTVAGVVTTNRIPMVLVEWTGSGVTASTPVQYRYADTNTWTEAVKLNVTTGAEWTTNWMQFATSQDITEYGYWHVGVDTPAVVITTSGIDLTGFCADGTGVSMTWTCQDPRAQSFTIWRREGADGEWAECLTTSQHNGKVTGFFLDKTYFWRVTSDFAEDD